MPNEEYYGINALGRVLQGQMKKTSESPLVLDFGVIKGDYSLVTNSYPNPIPVEDYQVCRTLTYGKVDTKLTETKKELDGEHSHPEEPTSGKHKHEVIVPEKMRTVKPGDRVLVAWVGNDAVVVDILKPATAIME